MRGWMVVVAVAVATILLVIFGVRALLRGRRLPPKAKLVIAGAVLWMLSPIDAIPEVFGPVGVLDDLVVLVSAIRYVLDRLEPPEGTDPHIDQALARRLDRRRAVEPDRWRIADDGDDRP